MNSTRNYIQENNTSEGARATVDDTQDVVEENGEDVGSLPPTQRPSQRPPRPTPADEQCPICLDNISIPTETNCGHLFCCK